MYNQIYIYIHTIYINLALIQATFHISDCFWMQEDWHPKKLKRNFSPKKVKFFKGSCTLLHCSHIHSTLQSC